MPARRVDPFVRFVARIERPLGDGCWLWNLRQSGRYGRFAVTHSKGARAHRWLWEYLHGPVPTGLELHHECENKRCVRPDHLRAVTPRENLHSSDTPARRNAAKTHCPAGHEYTPENTGLRRKGSGVMRRCRRCNADAAAARRARLRGS